MNKENVEKLLVVLEELKSMGINSAYFSKDDSTITVHVDEEMIDKMQIYPLIINKELMVKKIKYKNLHFYSDIKEVAE